MNNDKFTLLDLVDSFAQDNKIPKDKVESFVKNFFQLIGDGLEKDNYVKIKGFGTFKVIDIEPRESVNVNTGERFQIEGHKKITFTPDASIKDVVNQPFSSFETVLLDDNTSFDSYSDNEQADELNDNVDETTEGEDKVTAPVAAAIEQESEEATAPADGVASSSLDETTSAVSAGPSVPEETAASIAASLEEEQKSAEDDDSISSPDDVEKDTLEELVPASNTTAESPSHDVSKEPSEDSSHDVPNDVSKEVANDTEAMVANAASGEVEDVAATEDTTPKPAPDDIIAKELGNTSATPLYQTVATKKETKHSHRLKYTLEVIVVLIVLGALSGATYWLLTKKPETPVQSKWVNKTNSMTPTDSTTYQQSNENETLTGKEAVGASQNVSPIEKAANGTSSSNSSQKKATNANAQVSTGKQQGNVRQEPSNLRQNMTTPRNQKAALSTPSKTQPNTYRNPQLSRNVTTVRGQSSTRTNTTTAKATASSKNAKVKGNGKPRIIGLKTVHVMQVGDNMYTLAKKYLGSKDKANYIIEYNHFKDPNLVVKGTKIRIPKLSE